MMGMERCLLALTGWHWPGPTSPEPPLGFGAQLWGSLCRGRSGCGATVPTVPSCAPGPPFSHTLTVQLHARLGASALHLPPWGRRLLPGSRPPSMEGSGGAGSPRAARPGRRAGAGGGPGTARRGSAPPAWPPRRGSTISCCVALTFQQNHSRGPGPGGRLPASGRFLPWLGARKGRPWAPSVAAHLAPGLSAHWPAPQCLSWACPG